MLSSGRDRRSREGPGAARPNACGDREILIRARAGDRAAQAELVDRHLPVVYRLCKRLLGGREGADDATQEVFLRALGSLDRIDAEGNFRAWVCTIAWNFLRDERRKAKVREIVRRGAGEDPDGEGIFDPEDPKSTSPPEILAQKERREIVDRALDRLEPGLRAILVLRDVEGLSYEEVAAILGCRLGTAKSRIHRARMALKDVMVTLWPAWFEE